MESLRTLWNSVDWQLLGDLISRLLAVFLCLTVHETCHGLAACALGDPTAKRQHRLSFNPLRHIDWLGFASMLIAGFGWAKPVPVDMRYFKKPKQGMALTALAGPVSNLILALLAIAGSYAIYDEFVQRYGEENINLIKREGFSAKYHEYQYTIALIEKE